MILIEFPICIDICCYIQTSIRIVYYKQKIIYFVYLCISLFPRMSFVYQRAFEWSHNSSSVTMLTVKCCGWKCIRLLWGQACLLGLSTLNLSHIMLLYTDDRIYLPLQLFKNSSRVWFRWCLLHSYHATFNPVSTWAFPILTVWFGQLVSADVNVGKPNRLKLCLNKDLGRYKPPIVCDSFPY